MVMQIKLIVIVVWTGGGCLQSDMVEKEAVYRVIWCGQGVAVYRVIWWGKGAVYRVRWCGRGWLSPE